MSKITFAQALRDAMTEEMRQDENVFLMGEDIGLYGGCFGVTRGMLEEFGDKRIVETPISETAFTGAGVGASLMGLRPIIEIMFGDFVSLTFHPNIQIFFRLILSVFHFLNFEFYVKICISCPKFEYFFRDFIRGSF